MTYLNRHPDIYALGAIVLIVLALVFFAPDANAATPATPTPISDNCEQVATVGIIEYYWCESDYGDFFTNSYGFMVPD
jgi:hypothetical protein